MRFVHPFYLWLLVILAPLAWLHVTHRMGLGGVRAAAVGVVRLVAIALLILALARPIVRVTDETETWVVVADLSASLRDDDLAAWSRRLNERLTALPNDVDVQWVAFKAAPRVVTEVMSDEQDVDLVALRRNLRDAAGGYEAPQGSALAEALELARGLIPLGGRGRVLLLSDGRETRGDAAAAAYRLGQAGIGVDCLAVAERASGEVALASVTMPSFAGLGETVELTAKLSSHAATSARVTTRGTAGQTAEVPVSLEPGTQEVTCTLPVVAEGLQTFTVSVQADGDEHAGNNQLRAATFVLPPYDVRVVASRDDGPVAEGMSRMLGPAARVTSLDAKALQDADSLKGVELLVLADVPAEAIGREVMRELRRRVTDGMGLWVTGGRRSFGPGGYAKTPLEDVLPVRLTQKVERRDPSTTLVIIIDTSGSMGGPRVNLAKEIARLALRRLKPHDKAGIVEFYGSKRWAAPIQPASNAIDIQRALNRLTAGGGTVILPAIEEAYYALLNVRTRTRHVLVLTDGGVETGAFEPLIRKMADRGITLSTVLVGPGAHSAFLARLAHWGHGKSYHAPDRFNLPEIIVKQPESSLLSPFVERPSGLRLNERLPVSDGVDLGQNATVSGYVETASRPSADVVMRSELGHPLLAYWQFGLGRVAALTTQLSGAWSRELAERPGYAKLTANLARTLRAPRSDQAFDLRTKVTPAGVDVTVAARAHAGLAAGTPIELVLTSAANETRRVIVDANTTRTWSWRFEGLGPGPYRIDVRATTSDDKALAAVNVPPERELCVAAPREELLAELESISAREAASRRDEAAPPTRPIEIWPLLASLFGVLLLIHVLIRRLPVDALWRRGRRSRPGAAAALLIVAATCLTGSSAVAAATTRDVGSSQVKSPSSGQGAPARTTAPSTEPAAVFARRVRKAQILYDADKRSEARELLAAVIRDSRDGRSASTYCAHLAALCGDMDFATRTLEPSGRGKVGMRQHLFRGSWWMRLGRAAEAAKDFEAAYELATLSRDRRYATERLVAARRRAGRLSDLADAWLAKKDLRAERLEALIDVLAELDRLDDLLGLLQRPPATEDQRRLLNSADFQHEVIALAIDAGRIDQAERVYRKLVASSPQKVPYRVGLARLLMMNGRRADAREVFSKAVEQLADPDDLMALAEGARSLAMDEVALAAAHRAAKAGEGARVRATLFEADLARRRGATDRAVELLGRLRPVAQRDAKVLLPLAEAYERYGHSSRALELLNRLYQRTGAEDTLQRLAWLTEEKGNLQEARELWKQLWKRTDVAARRNQAQVRLLDLAARTGTLADLAIELEERLDAGKGGEKELSLLVEIYAGANDPVSAAEVLHEFGKRSGDQVDMLQRLAKVYLSCEQFGRCNAILDKLIEEDPDKAAEYLQQIAIVALEQRRLVEARRALAELARREPDGDLVDEFSAGVLNVMGSSQEAARAYERVIADQPDRIEVYLLWAEAMKAAGRTEQAVARFQSLLETAAEDDLFTIAVDGLLNLSAPPKALVTALHRIRERIVLKPDKVFLYRLAADVLDAMGKTDEMRRVLAQAVVVAGQRRAALLRELIDGSKADGRTDDVVRYGRTLLSLGDEVPPGVFLDVGEAFIRSGQLATASRIFRRAGIHGEFAQIQRRVADTYDAADMPDRAERIIRELLIGQPDSLDLLIRAGGLCEQMGRFEQAFEHYDRAARLLLSRLPMTAKAVGKDDDAAGSKRGRRRRRAMNLTEVAQYFESASNGLISVARTPTLQERLVGQWRQATIAEMDELSDKRLIKARLKENPRLERLIGFLRYIAFALHRPDTADEVDRKLLKLYPKDDSLTASMVAARLRWGLWSRALKLTAPAKDIGEPRLTALRLLKDPKAPEQAIAGGELPAEVVRHLLPGLLCRDRTSEARKLVSAALDQPLKAPMSDLAKTLYASIVVLADGEAMQRWVSQSLSACRSVRDAKGLAKTVEEIADLAWSFGDEAGRRGLIRQIKGLAPAAKGTDRVRLDLLRLRLAKRLQQEVGDADAIVERALADGDLDASSVARLIDAAPADQRAKLIEKAVAARKPPQRRAFLMELIGSMRSKDSEALAATVGRLFKAAPKMRMRASSAYGTLTRFGWHRNPTTARSGLAMAEVLLGEGLEDPIIMAVTALARHTAGLHDQAVLLASEAIDALAGAKELGYNEQRPIADLGRILTDEELTTIAEDLAMRADIEGESTSLLFANGLLLSAGGRQTDGIASLRKAFVRSPDELSISRRLIILMKDSGRNVELVRLLSKHLTKSSIMQSYQWRTLTDLYVALHDLDAALAAARKIDSPLGPVEVLRTAALLGQSERVLTILRRFLIHNRNESRFYSPFWPEPPSVGGMRAWLELEGQSRYPRARRDRLFAGLADQPFAETEFEALLQAAPPDRHDVEGLARGRLAAAREAGTLDKLIAQLEGYRKQEALNAKDALTRLLIADEAPAALTKLPKPDENAPPGQVTWDDTPGLTNLARHHATHGRLEAARAILRWVIAWDLLGERGSFSGLERLDRIEAYAETFPKAERPEAMLEILGWLGAITLDRRHDWLSAKRLILLSERLPTEALLAEGALVQRLLDEVHDDRRMVLTRLALARIQARCGKVEAFVEVVRSVVPDVVGSDGAHSTRDLRWALPPAKDLERPEHYLGVLVERLLGAPAATQGVKAAEVVPSLCLLGVWAHENGLAGQASEILDHAEKLAPPLRPESLWVADLARTLDDPDRAAATELKLLKARRLPVTRVPGLLDRVEKQKGRAAADALAVGVASYSDHPAVAKRAERHAAKAQAGSR